MKSAQAIAAEHGHANMDSATVLATVTVNSIEYDLRVCGVGKEAFFEWINDGGDPVGDVFDEIESVEAAKSRFSESLILSNRYTEILQHRIRYFLCGDDAPVELDGGSVKYIEKNIKDGYTEGELCVVGPDSETEFRGWWAIEK